MDKVLTRKLFRDKYFQKHKPKTFNKGGLAGIQKFQTGIEEKPTLMIIATTQLDFFIIGV